MFAKEIQVMRNEKQAPVLNKSRQADGAAKPPQNAGQHLHANEQQERRKPFTFAAGWLGNAFDRSQIHKREAEERRSRNM